MYNIILRFSKNKSAAPEFMQGHKEWIKEGFDEGVFIAVGSLLPEQGGAIWAYQETLEEIENRVARDPFVVEHVVTAEIQAIKPAITDPRFDFLMNTKSAA